MSCSFQFPSNGKVYPKRSRHRRKPTRRQRFNSLQTGKCIQSVPQNQEFVINRYVSIPFKRESVSKDTWRTIGMTARISFNSLQTGKCIQSLIDLIIKVRIACFNSLQTGKCIQRKKGGENNEFRKVSIPFKRESVSKVVFVTSFASETTGFNSLQTGKCIQRSSLLTELTD